MKVEHNGEPLYSQFHFIPADIMSHYVSQQGTGGVRLVCDHCVLICTMALSAGWLMYWPLVLLHIVPLGIVLTTMFRR
jgi:hypothetical protein